MTQFLFWLGGLRIAWECKHTISNKNVGDLFGCHTALGSFPSGAEDHGSEQLYVLPELACTANSWEPQPPFFHGHFLLSSVCDRRSLELSGKSFHCPCGPLASISPQLSMSDSGPDFVLSTYHVVLPLWFGVFLCFDL